MVAYAQPTQIASWLDHAGVYTGTGDKYIFACAGENPDEKQIRYTVSGTGDLKKAITLASGDINAYRRGNVFNTSNDYCGIIYGIDGVCHQMTNRVMYSSGVTMDKSQLYGGSLSYTLYGVYGHGWDKYLKKCEEQWNNKTSNNLRERLLTNAKGMMKDYLEIEFSTDSDVVKIMKRIDVLLKYQYDRNFRVDKRAMYQAATDFVNNVHRNNDIIQAEYEFRRFNGAMRNILGNEGYKQLFGLEYDINKLKFQMM